jgi:hypothetical protein
VIDKLQPIPAGDVFLHAGDFTRSGAVSEVREFNTWLGQVSDLFAISYLQYHDSEVLFPDKISSKFGTFFSKSGNNFKPFFRNCCLFQTSFLMKNLLILTKNYIFGFEGRHLYQSQTYLYIIRSYKSLFFSFRTSTR